MQAVKSWQSVQRVTNQERAAVCLVFTLQAHGSVVWTKWPPPVPQHPLCRSCLFSTGAKKAAHCSSWEHFPCLTWVIAIIEYYSSSTIKECCIPTKTYLTFFPQLQQHPTFTSQVMVKTEVFQLSWTTIYIPYSSTLLASGAECACQEHHSQKGFDGLHPDKPFYSCCYQQLEHETNCDWVASQKLLEVGFYTCKMLHWLYFDEMIYCF